MVFTGEVRISETRWGRRRVLGAATAGTVAAALSGCGLLNRHHDPAPQPTPDVLRPLLDDAVALVAAYDRAVVAQPGLAARLTPLANDHREHVTVLARAIGTPAPSGPQSAPAPSGPQAAPASGEPAPAQVVASLRAAEQAAQRTAADVCKRAPATRAALAGSVAACRAAHAEALR